MRPARSPALHVTFQLPHVCTVSTVFQAFVCVPFPWISSLPVEHGGQAALVSRDETHNNIL